MPPQSIANLVYIDSTGYYYADFPTFLAWYTANYQSIYGADVYLGADSQDGQWVTVQAQAASDLAQVGASIYNSFSPLTAQGLGLARVVRINGLTKEVASYSSVVLTIVGVAGTSLINCVAQDVLGQLWEIPATVIPSGGSITVTAQAATLGFITAEPNTVTTIYTPTLGWQTVNNASAATPGGAVESDAALRIRQALSTALPAQTVLQGQAGAVANVTGVTKVQYYENDSETTNSYGMPPNSITIVAIGGNATEIAQAIQVTKTPGVITYGGNNPVSTLVYDSEGMPLYINYDEGATAEIQVTVNLTPTVGWSANYIPLIQAAVAAVINATAVGGNQQSGILYYTSLFPAAYLNGTPQGQTYDITGITVGKNGGGQSAANISLLFDENPVCNASVDVTVNVA
jgi:uncharacterized phage protein gp47/JayE